MVKISFNKNYIIRKFIKMYLKEDYSNFCTTKILVTDGESIRLCIQSEAGRKTSFCCPPLQPGLHSP